jgi:hypothetical protein
MDSLTSPAVPVKASRPAVVTGTLTTGAGNFLADLLNESAVLTLNDPDGQRVFWVGAIVDGGQVVGLRLRRFNTGELYLITFDTAARADS